MLSFEAEWEIKKRVANTSMLEKGRHYDEDVGCLLTEIEHLRKQFTQVVQKQLQLDELTRLQKMEEDIFRALGQEKGFGPATA